MAQFDVHLNIGKQRQHIPYVVVVQSALYDSYRRRVVVPLVLRAALTSSELQGGSRINPVFTIEGREVVMHPLEIVSIALDQMGEKIGSLSDEGDAILNALDEVLTRAWK